MSLKFKSDIRVFVFETVIDLRAGFDRLSYLVRAKMGAKLVDGDLFVFFGKNRRRHSATHFQFERLSLN